MQIAGDRIEHIQVLRGAPCGATWQAAETLIGCQISTAVTRMGLKTQIFCTADPSAWDPISGRSPVHIAGELHAMALKRALSSMHRKL